MADLAKEVCKELGWEDWHIECGYVNDCIEPALDYIRQGAKVIVSRGMTADALEKMVDIKVVRMTTSPYDIIPLISNISCSNQKIGVIGFPMSIYGINGLNESLLYQIEEFTISSTNEIPDAIRRAKALGIKIIIGGKITVKEAQKEGLTGLMFRSGKSTIAAAMNHAIELVEEQKREKARGDQFRLILDFCNNGIVVTDQAGIITFTNKLAAIMLNYKESTIIGQNVSSIIPDIMLVKCWEDFNYEKSNVLELENKNLIYNATAIVTDEELTGYIVSLQYVRSIERLADATRKKLYQQGLVAKYNFNDIITQSLTMFKTIKQAKKYALVDSTILITGQTGTGKEMLAQSIHNVSHRKNGPFVAINCASIPESLLESELFGYESGAFTGAKKNGHKGYFELASGGTLFLDEIGEMPMNLQSSLLRVLQEHSIIRVGGDMVIPVDIRIICATHQDLQDACENNTFRFDLYHRLNILRLHVPPLKERIEDIPLLAEILIRKKATKLGLNPIVLAEEVLTHLCHNSWRGNVRELEGVLERLVVLRSGEIIRIEEFKEIFFDKSFDYQPVQVAKEQKHTSTGLLKDIEKQTILAAYQTYHGNRKEMCQALSISKTTLWRKLKEYGL